MGQLGDIFSSRARTEVLFALVAQPCAIGLRQLSYVTKIPTRSVELAVARLHDQGWVHWNVQNRQAQIKLDAAHPDYELLLALWDTAQQVGLRQRGLRMGARAKAVLSHCKKTRRLMSRAKRHATRT